MNNDVYEDDYNYTMYEVIARNAFNVAKLINDVTLGNITVPYANELLKSWGLSDLLILKCQDNEVYLERIGGIAE